MKFRNFNNKQYFIVLAVVVLFLALVPSLDVHNESEGRAVVFSQDAKEHILYGNLSGGGHLYGVGKPCKSEFPKDWSVDKVISTVTKQAANDNLNWRRENNGYHVSEKIHEHVKVRVVLDDDLSHIITAYPVNQPRNPCKVK